MITLDLGNNSNADGRQKIESTPIVESKTDVEPQGKSRKPLILIGLVVFMLLVGGLAFWTFPYFMGTRSSLLGTKGTAIQKSKHEQVKATLALEPFLVNLADKDEVRFVKTTFQLGLAEEPNEDAKSDVAVAAMRDSIISLLSSKTAEQILTPEGKDKLREEIRLRVGAISPGIKILEVYIVDFVVQL
jgi:flagellar FliL protein